MYVQTEDLFIQRTQNFDPSYITSDTVSPLHSNSFQTYISYNETKLKFSKRLKSGLSWISDNPDDNRKRPDASRQFVEYKKIVKLQMVFVHMDFGHFSISNPYDNESDDFILVLPLSGRLIAIPKPNSSEQWHQGT